MKNTAERHLSLVPAEPENREATVTPIQAAAETREQTASTLSPRSLQQHLDSLQSKLLERQLTAEDLHQFMASLEKFLAAPNNGGFGLDRMVLDLHDQLRQTLATFIGGNTVESMVGQKKALEDRLAALGPRIQAYAEEANRMASFLV